jgi:hypothetical protein
MTERYFHVEFDVVTNQNGFEPSSWAPGYLRAEAKSTPRNEMIRVPKDAKITELAPPMADGYYLYPNSGTLYRRLNGDWMARRDHGGWAWSSVVTSTSERKGELPFLKYIGPIINEEDE